MRTLRTKILLGYGASLVLVGVILTLAIVLLLRLGRASEAILKENYRSILAAENMIDALERQDSAVLLILLGFKDQGRLEFKENEVFFLQWLGRARDNITIAGEAELIEGITGSFTRYLLEVNQLQHLDAKDHAGAVRWYHENVLSHFRAIRDACIKLRDLNHETMYAASNRAGELAVKAVGLISLTGTAAVVIGVVFSLLLSRLISRPVTELKEAVLRIGQGDYGVQVAVRGAGELALLGEQFNRMADKLRQYHEMNIGQILAEKRKSEAIIRSVDDGLVVVDENCRITNLNPRAAAILGVMADETCGRHFLEVVREDKVFQAVKETLEGGQAPRLAEGEDLLTVTREGQNQFYQIAILPMRGREGAVWGAVVLLRDITRLKELDRLKSDFVMTASHELRTPLTSIGMAVDILLESAAAKLSDRERELLQASHEEVQRLKALVNDLLDLARIEAGKLELAREVVAPTFLAQQAAGVVRNQAEGKGIALEVAVAEDLPEVMADANKIVWVLVNLLGNAIRFTKAGGHIRLAAEQVKDRLQIKVQDDGEGIPLEMQSRVFDKFVQLDRGEGMGGSGLGLAIGKEIVRAHGGVIWLESTPGRGSTFTFTLPLAPRQKEEIS